MLPLTGKDFRQWVWLGNLCSFLLCKSRYFLLLLLSSVCCYCFSLVVHNLLLPLVTTWALSSPHLRCGGNQPLCGALKDHRCQGHSSLFFPIIRKQPQLCTFSISQNHDGHYWPSHLEDVGLLSPLCETEQNLSLWGSPLRCQAVGVAPLLLFSGGKVSVVGLFRTSQRSTCHRIVSIPSATLGIQTVPIPSAFGVR